MMLRTGAGGLASRFAHLAGLRPAKAAAGKSKAEEQAEKDKASAGAEEDDEKDKPDEDEGDKDTRAEDDEKKPDDSDDDDKKDDAKAEARGAARERERCAAIFAAPEASANLALAAHLAFETDLTVKQAVGALAAGGAAPASEPEQPRRSSLDARMERQPKANLGTGTATGPDMSTPAGAAAFILGAGRAAKKEG